MRSVCVFTRNRCKYSTCVKNPTEKCHLPPSLLTAHLAVKSIHTNQTLWQAVGPQVCHVPLLPTVALKVLVQNSIKEKPQDGIKKRAGKGKLFEHLV